MAPMIVIDHGPYKWRAACIDVLPSSSLPSSVAHLPEFPHKEQTRPKKNSCPRSGQVPAAGRKRGKFRSPADGHHPSPTPARISTAAMKSTFRLIIISSCRRRREKKGFFSSFRFGGFEETFDIDRRILFLFCCSRKRRSSQ